MPDLDSSVRAFEERYGLSAVAGGRHPGAGTGNAIVSLGGRQYLELIAVVDPGEAELSQRSRRVSEAVAGGATFATWVLRTDDLDGMRSLLGAGEAIRPGSRRRPDGTLLEWRSLDLEPGLPFLISWGGSAHPGAEGAGGVTQLVLEDAPAGPLRALLGRIRIDVAYELREGSAPGLIAVELDAGGRRVTVS